MESSQDSELIGKAKLQDFKAYEKLIKKYEAKLYTLIYRMLGNKEEAKDVLQDTFLSIFRGLKDFRGDSNFSTWVYRIATNNALMKLRKRKHEHLSIDSEVSSEVTDWSSNIKSSLDRAELKNILDSAISSLPVKYRTVFILRDIDGLSTEEVAKIVGISIGAVKSRLRRARLYLRETLSKYFEGRGKQIVLRPSTSILPYEGEA